MADTNQKPPERTPPDLTVADAAKQLKLTSQQVLNRVKRDSIHGTKVGWVWMIKQSEVDRVKQLLQQKTHK